MKNSGKRFEEDFQNSVPESWFCYRLRDAGGWSKSSDLRFTPSNICDFIVFDGRRLFLLELKTVQGKSIPFTMLKQLDDLIKYNSDIVNAGFVLNFRKAETTVYIDVEILNQYVNNADRKSVPVDWAVENGVIIPQELKRTRYRYLLDYL